MKVSPGGVYGVLKRHGLNKLPQNQRKRSMEQFKRYEKDNGHEFQAQFHWHCEDLGICHVYIKKASPHLTGKVERCHLTDKYEFYHLLEYKDDIDIEKKLSEWETFYNCHRPNSALNGKTPYEVLIDKLLPA